MSDRSMPGLCRRLVRRKSSSQSSGVEMWHWQQGCEKRTLPGQCETAVTKGSRSS